MEGGEWNIGKSLSSSLGYETSMKLNKMLAIQTNYFGRIDFFSQKVDFHLRNKYRFASFSYYMEQSSGRAIVHSF